MSAREGSASLMAQQVLRRISTRKRWLSSLVPILFAIALASCSKKPQVTRVPPPPSPVPTASIEASPSTLQPGQSAMLTWKATNATQVEIEHLGTVELNGSRSVAPKESTTYKLIANGPGGTQEAVARVTVTAGRESASTTQEELFAPGSGRQDVFFNTDDYSIRRDQEDTVFNDAAFVDQHPDLGILVEGHCDELGSTEYNIALGDLRASEVKTALTKAGVGQDRITTISYGKERPFCSESSEECRKLNRRAHLVASTQR